MDKTMLRTWAEVRLDDLVHNMKTIRASLPAGTGLKFLGVVKADAYGHGAVPAARALTETEKGADYLAVACPDEALELRDAGIDAPLLILGPVPAERVPELLCARVTLAVGSFAAARTYSDAASACGGTLRVHIKVDTGMSRTGFQCTDTRYAAGVAEIAAACRAPHLEAEGIFTHFAVSDEPDKPESIAYTRKQFQLFADVISALEREGITFPLRHCANTGATLYFPEPAALDMVRPGILLYGYGDVKGKLDLRPCMRLKTRVAAVQTYPAGTRVSYGGTFITERETRMGVLPVGYADGLHRCLGNRCEFYTPQGLAPQRGRICMDMCMIDLTDLPEVNAGDPIEIFGPHARLEKLAGAAGTITYELLCAVSRRVPRIYC